MRVLLLRHGATASNETHRYAGARTDEPLSDIGTAQCERLATWLGKRDDVRVVFTSPLMRARQTAELCFPDAQITAVPGLEEFDFGDFEGRTPNEMEADKAYRAWVDSNCEDPCPNGESLADFVSRTKSALHEALRSTLVDDEGCVAVVAHGGTVMAALDGFYDKHVGNCEGYVARVRLNNGEIELTDVQRMLFESNVS